MRGCLFVVLLAALVAGVIVVVGLPAVAAGVLTAGVRAAGLQADDLTVTVVADPPWDLLTLRADRVRVRASHASYRGIRIGSLDATLGGVNLVDRSAATVAGRLATIRVPDVSGQPLTLEAITLAGGGPQVTAATTIGAAQAQAIIAAEAGSLAGTTMPPGAVRLVAPDRVTVAGVPDFRATLGVDAAGDLVAVTPDAAPVILLRAGEDVPMRFTSVRVDGQGNLAIAGTLTVGLLGG